MHAQGPVVLGAFECNQGKVLLLVARDDTIYAGCQDGRYVNPGSGLGSRCPNCVTRIRTLAMFMVNSDYTRVAPIAGYRH